MLKQEGEKITATSTADEKETESKLAGTWNLTIATPEKSHKPTATFEVKGEKLTGTLRTDTLTFGFVILGTILLVGALLFLPAAVLGPVAEHLGPMPFGG